jgi:capsular exopolysaccharide synthesis family protein
VSRIYDAMKRGALAEASSRTLVAPSGDHGQPVDPVAEGFQRILQAIQSGQGSKGGGVILVVSAVHGEGASTIARELALLLARDGLAKPVLVDANLRTPNQHRAFGVERTGGLTELVTQALPLDRAVRNGSGSLVPLVTCGRPAGNATAVLGAPALRAAVEALRAKYDWVVLDGAPVTVYSDAGILAGWVDGVVLVVEAERTRAEVVTQAKRALEESGARIFGAVLNRQRHHIPPALYRRL